VADGPAGVMNIPIEKVVHSIPINKPAQGNLLASTWEPNYGKK
jgi:hypothetical protein